MYNRLKPKSLPLLALFLSVLFLVLDSSIDVFVFKESDSFLENFFSPEPVELWMRGIVVLSFILFSFYARYLLRLQIKASDKLLRYKNELEEIVSVRTKALENKNQELQDEILMRKKIEETLKKIVELNHD